jgi:hypothetical protein
MPTKQLAGAKLHYAADDAETPAAFEALSADVLNLAREQFGLALPPKVQVYVVNSWSAWLWRASGWQHIHQ